MCRQGLVEVVKKGSVKNIAVNMEDRMGGRKHLTHLVHVESFGLNPDELGAEMQRRFKTSCSVTKLPGKTETGKEIALQGNLLQVSSAHAASGGLCCAPLVLSALSRLSL
jgi:translation initiation factor 2D